MKFYGVLLYTIGGIGVTYFRKKAFVATQCRKCKVSAQRESQYKKWIYSFRRHITNDALVFIHSGEKNLFHDISPEKKLY